MPRMHDASAANFGCCWQYGSLARQTDQNSQARTVKQLRAGFGELYVAARQRQKLHVKFSLEPCDRLCQPRLRDVEESGTRSSCLQVEGSVYR